MFSQLFLDITLWWCYKPTFTNISNLHLPFLISHNACFMISHLRFAHLLDKALALLLQNRHNQKVLHNSGTVSYVKSTDWLAKRYEINSNQCLTTNYGLTERNNREKELSCSIDQQWASLKKLCFRCDHVCTGGSCDWGTRSQWAVKRAPEPLFLLWLRMRHSSWQILSVSDVLSALLKFKFCAQVKLYEWLPLVNST